ncbi:domain protein [Seminavis robusta]|uniref:Domain protein n=1 Tax=Seminavis robusta TaxID=568900 RepID=A0A9N8HPH9_9STRA|nr:domain protein [Seminavis robusta]|eukprot:Sro1070_g237810.1 domain protein (236) ;mRNA; r:30608-31315
MNSASLPAGWTSAIDPSSGRVYYANSTTGESSWEPPSIPQGQDFQQLNRRRQDEPDYHGRQQQDYHGQRQEYDRPQNHQQQRQYESPAQPAHQYQEQHHGRNPLLEAQQQPLESSTEHGSRPAALTTTTKTSTVSSVSALASSGLLVPAARAIVDSDQDVNTRKDIELYGITAGQLADLCAIQKEEMSERQIEFKPYTPITPYAISNTARRPPMEPGRLEIRLHSLYNQLRKIHE